MAMRVTYLVLDGEIISENRNGVERDYLPDPQGNTVALLDNTQTKTDTFSYWPYGEVKSHVGPSTTPFQYGGSWGYYTDSSSRLYVRARCPDVVKGRWMTEDPIGFAGRSWNLYGYVGQNPTSASDPSGQLQQPVSPNPRSPIGHPASCQQVRDCLSQPGRPRCGCSSNHPKSVDTMLCIFWQETSLGTQQPPGGIGSGTPDGFDDLIKRHKCKWLSKFKNYNDFVKNATPCEKAWQAQDEVECNGLDRFGPGKGKPGDYRDPNMSCKISKCESCLKSQPPYQSSGGWIPIPVPVDPEKWCKQCLKNVHL